MTDNYNWQSGAIRYNNIIYFECSQWATLLHLTAWMLLYIGDEMCLIYTYKIGVGC